MSLIASDTGRSLPLAELHCHIKGTIVPSLAQKLANRHGLDISRLINADGGYVWSTFQEFLASYDGVAAAVRAPEDYQDVVRTYYLDAAARGLIYAEFFLSAGHVAAVGLPYETVLDAIAETIRDIEARTGLVIRIILTSVRHYGVEHTEQAARLLADHPHPLVVGFGIAGDEAAGAHRDFKRAFDIARETGVGLTAHAGEVLGPESVREALRHFGVRRLGHGVQAIDDPDLVRELADRGIVLEVCPTSNLCIGLYATMADHPVKRLADAGVPVTLSTDDPGFFRVTIDEEYEKVAKAHDLGPEALRAFTCMSIEAGFCDTKVKETLLDRLARA